MNAFEEFVLLVPESKEYSLEYMAKLENTSNKNKFISFINERRGESIIDVAVQYCDVYGIDIESVANFIKTNDILLSRIRIEAEDINMVEKLERLPI